ncbi:MAG TPA: cytochrome c, partial [Gemmatimonadaceae bacterium]
MQPRPIVVRAAQLGVCALVLIGASFARQPRELSASSADPTFAEDVAPIFYRNCTACHHPGGLAPFSLVEYDSAKAKLDETRDAVAAGVMPPWHADGPHGVFSNDRRLPEADRQTILRWIDGGAKPGDLKKLPPRPDYPVTWAMGKPDLIVGMQDDFTVPASGMVEYQYFEIPTGLTEEKWVQAMEIVPGAREVVHHVLVYAKVPPNANAVQAAAPAPQPRPAGAPAPQPLFLRKRGQGLPPDPPRLDTLHPPPRQMGVLVASLAPGTNVLEFPKGTAMRLRPGTVLTFQMHYTAHGHEMKDRTMIGFKFAKEMPDEEILASQLTNGNFTIRAGMKDSVPAEMTATQPVRIWGLLPHTHLRGTRWHYELVLPDSSRQ